MQMKNYRMSKQMQIIFMDVDTIYQHAEELIAYNYDEYRYVGIQDGTSF